MALEKCGALLEKRVTLLEKNSTILQKCEARCEWNGAILVAIAQSLTLGEGRLVFIDAERAWSQFFLVSRGRCL